MTAAHPAKASDRLAVLICAPGEAWGGVDRFVHSLALGLERRDVAVRVVLFHDDRLAASLRQAGVPVDIIATSGHDPRQGTRLRDLQRRFGADLIHTHGYRASVAAAAARLAGADAPIVKTEHGRLEWPSHVSNLPGFAKLLVNSALDCAATRGWVDEIIYVSRDTQLAVAPWMGQGTVIVNGIDAREVRRAAGVIGQAGASFTAGLVGRLVPVKGHEYFLRALAQLPTSFEGRIVGTGPEEGTLRRLAGELGILERVHFEGFVAPVYPTIAALDALVMPSLHEGLPIAALEAMALGVPVVASNVGGLPEVIDDGITGQLVPPRDPAALAAALYGLQQDRGRARLLTENALAKVRTTFDVDTMVDAYLRVYRRVTAGEPRTLDRLGPADASAAAPAHGKRERS